MLTVTLMDGREVHVNTDTMTTDEWRGLNAAAYTTKDDNKVVAKVTNLKLEEIGELAFQDYRRVIAGIARDATRPLSKNFLSASTEGNSQADPQ